jgi:nucleoside-diphosphate-sugar epimerase
VIGIVGANGFVGSNLRRIFPESIAITRSELAKGCPKSFSTVIIAAPAANKWQINQDPVADRENIQKLVKDVTRLDTNRFVLFSTIDVYSSPSDSSEDSECLESVSYGGNRYYLEGLLRQTTEHLLVRRLGGLFGPGLRKNLIFDALNNRIGQLGQYHPESRYQYLSIDTSIKLSLSERLTDIATVNIVGEPIAAKRLVNQKAVYLSTDVEKVNYDIKSNHSFNDPYFCSAESVLESLNEYLGTRL